MSGHHRCPDWPAHAVEGLGNTQRFQPFALFLADIGNRLFLISSDIRDRALLVRLGLGDCVLLFLLRQFDRVFLVIADVLLGVAFFLPFQVGLTDFLQVGFFGLTRIFLVRSLFDAGVLLFGARIFSDLFLVGARILPRVFLVGSCFLFCFLDVVFARFFSCTFLF